jgi:hypothetical protein
MKTEKRVRSKYDVYTIKQRIADLNNVVAIQCSAGNYDVGEYMRGMANGLLLAQHIICGKYGTEVKYLKEPKK